jgi:hypothetical protein
MKSVREPATLRRRAAWLAPLFLLPSLARGQLPPSAVGQWTPPATWPQAPVHLMLQPDGTVLMWPAGCGCIPNRELNGGANARIWDPASNTFTIVPNLQTNLFCAGHAPLADGRMLVIGGHIDYFVGVPDTNIFDPATRAWTRVRNMAQARWYPTATRLPDGRVLAISGTIQRGEFADVPEVYDPATDSWTSLPAATLRNPYYSFLFVLPGGTVFNAGPDRQTRSLDVATQTWTAVGDSLISAHSAVLYERGRIMKCGTRGDADFPPSSVDARTVVIDMNQPAPQWREVAPMAFPRAYHNLTLLPDGTVLVTGGGQSPSGQDVANAVYEAELWDPSTETWRTLAPMQRPRLYHSTALLLPDGRVVSAGGEFYPYLEENAQIFSPPYLFRGPRPTTTSAPAVVTYGSLFTVATPDAADIERVSLLAPTSVTHGFDQNQRYLSLGFAPDAGALTIQAPAGPDLAPPGYYMLFLVSSAGVPSVARFVQLTLAPDAATTSTTVTSTTTLTTATTIPPSPAGSPVAAYGFAEGAGAATADASGNANNGTLVGASWTSQGRFGSALVFDGSGAHVAIPDNASLDLTDELTLEAWVNPSALGGYRVILDKTTTGTPSNYYLALVGSQLNFGFFNDGWREHTAATALVPGTWYHVAATYSDAADSVRLYVDGAEVLSEPELNSLLPNAEQLRIGVGFSNEGFSGRIDEVRVYARVLTAAEIQADMNRPVTGTSSTTTRPPTTSTTTTSTTSTTRTTTSTTRPPDLIAAYGFEEASGETVLDASGNGNTGTISGATRTTAGRFGRALVFDGVTDWVTVNDAPLLDLTGGMTLEAWVYPSSAPSLWRTIVAKERPGQTVYFLHASSSDGSRPAVGAEVNGVERFVSGGSPLTAAQWVHLAGTYDGTRQRLYVNGTEVASQLASGPITVSAGPLRIGGNGVWGEYFAGRIDEVRIYSRALSVAEIQADMNRAVAP